MNKRDEICASSLFSSPSQAERTSYVLAGGYSQGALYSLWNNLADCHCRQRRSYWFDMVDVRNGSMSISRTVINGLAKGTVALLAFAQIPRTTASQVTVAAIVLVATGYLIDSSMKKSKEDLCQVESS